MQDRTDDATEEPTDTQTIPLRGRHIEIRGSVKRNLCISSSDCSGFVPPARVSEKHRAICETIDRRKVRDGEVHGHIEYDADGTVVDWNVDEALLEVPDR
jgi:hypothetical protein